MASRPGSNAIRHHERIREDVAAKLCRQESREDSPGVHGSVERAFRDQADLRELEPFIRKYGSDFPALFRQLVSLIPISLRTPWARQHGLRRTTAFWTSLRSSNSKRHLPLPICRLLFGWGSTRQLNTTYSPALKTTACSTPSRTFLKAVSCLALVIASMIEGRTRASDADGPRRQGQASHACAGTGSNAQRLAVYSRSASPSFDITAIAKP